MIVQISVTPGNNYAALGNVLGVLAPDAGQGILYTADAYNQIQQIAVDWGRSGVIFVPNGECDTASFLNQFSKARRVYSIAP